MSPLRPAMRLLALAAVCLAGLSHWALGGKGRFTHVILFIGDGMSVPSEVAASRYLYGRDDGLAWQALPGRAYVATWDVTAYNRNARLAGRAPYKASSFAPWLGYDVLQEGSVPPPCGIPFEGAGGTGVLRPATDSASAATAMATGWKTDSGNIAWLPGDPPGGRLRTILEDFRDKHRAAVGVVSTVPFSHATPAAFVSHNVSRSNYYTGYRGYRGLGIADEIILEVKPDVVIGGGHPLYDNPADDPGLGYISRRLYGVLRESADYVLAEKTPGQDGGRVLLEAASRAAAEHRKLFGLFGGSAGNFALPVPVDRPGAPGFERATGEDPTLAEAAEAALTVMARNTTGFFLMIEQGDIDWANHDNDFRGMVGAMHDLDEAVRAVQAFVDRPGDPIDWTNTILVVMADHATGGLCLNPTRPMGAGVLPVQVARGPASGPVDRTPANGGQQGKPGRTISSFNSPYVYPGDEVAYGTIGHTNELVTLAVSGSAASLFLCYKGWWYPGPIIDNTQINAALREALGLSPIVRHPENEVAGSSRLPRGR